MSNDLPARYRRYSSAPNGNELVNCLDCANYNGIPAAIIPRSAIPQHEEWHNGPNAAPAAPRSGPWPEISLEPPLRRPGPAGRGVLDVPLTRLHLAHIAAGHAVTIRTADGYDVGTAADRPLTIFLRLADDERSHLPGEKKL